MKADLHLHTEYSFDCDSKISNIIDYAERRRLDAIAITDHDTMDGYHSLISSSLLDGVELRVIPGVEMTVPIGEYGLHLVALGVDSMPSYETIEDAIETVDRDGGVITLPHPYRQGTGLFYHMKSGHISEDEVQYVLDNVSFVEGLNMKDSTEDVAKTLDLVTDLDIPIVSGSDAHKPEYVGSTYTVIDGLFSEPSQPKIVTYATETENISKQTLRTHLLDFSEDHGVETPTMLKRLGHQVLSRIPLDSPLKVAKSSIDRVEKQTERSEIQQFFERATLIEIDRQTDEIRIQTCG